MANIYTIIQKEVEKGNTLVDRAGNFINPAKVEVMAKKSYLADLKNGVIPFDKSFTDYHRDIIEFGYIPAIVMESILQAEVGTPVETDCSMPEPEISEEIAN